MRIEPPVSVPIEANAMPASTDAAEPPDDPPASGVGSSGWCTGPNAESSLVGAKRELVQVGLADEDRAGFAQPGDDGGVAVGDVRRSHPRRRGRRRARAGR